MTKTQNQFLNSFLQTLTQEQRKKHSVISVEHFCNNENDANALAQLVLQGKKTATCSMKYWYDKNDNEVKPRVGNLMLVTDFSGRPMCITETVSVEISRFCDVGAEFAYAEGEGDRTLSSWQKVHWDFFSAECKEEGVVPSKKMELYLEEFKLVWK